WFRRRYREQVGPVATLGYLAGAFWDPADAFEAGRMLIRWWLECTRFGLYIHPYGNLMTHRPTAARVAEELAVNDVWLVFKIGRSPTPPASLRRSFEELQT